MDKIKRGDIFLADLGEGLGSEQHGVRPVLVVQNNIGNKYSPTITVLPITSKIHKSKGLPTHINIEDVAGLERRSSIMAEQITTIDKAKLLSFIGRVTDLNVMKEVDRGIRIQLSINSKKRSRHIGGNHKYRGANG